MNRTDLLLKVLTLYYWTFYIVLGTLQLHPGNTAMTKRFHTNKSTQRCDEKLAASFSQALKNKGEEISLLEAIKSEKEQVARHILLEQQFSNLEIQDKRRDGNYKHLFFTVSFKIVLIFSILWNLSLKTL